MDNIKNSPYLFIMGGIVATFVIAQSLFFLVKSFKQGQKLGIDSKTMKKTIISSAIFSITPSLSSS